MSRVHVKNEAGVDITAQNPKIVEHWNNVIDALISQHEIKYGPECLDVSGDPFECCLKKYPCEYVFDGDQIFFGEIDDTFPKPCRQFKNGDCSIRGY